jgi:hypothetical protein
MRGGHACATEYHLTPLVMLAPLASLPQQVTIAFHRSGSYGYIYFLLSSFMPPSPIEYSLCATPSRPERPEQPVCQVLILVLLLYF